MNNLQYSEFTPQAYLLDKNLSIDDKRLIFSLRTRMSKFGGNFRSGRLETCYPLCSQHLDSQFFLIHCSVVKNEVEAKYGIGHLDDMNKIFSEQIDYGTVRALKFAMDIRTMKLNN